MSSFAETFRVNSYGLVLPKEHDEEVRRFVSTHSTGHKGAELRPFRRQVDFWAFSIVAALANDVEPLKGPVGRWGKTFIYTHQGILDNDLCSLLAVIAVAKLGVDNPEALHPKGIVSLANGLAGAGCPIVLDKVKEPDLRVTPLDRALTFAVSLRQRVGQSG